MSRFNEGQKVTIKLTTPNPFGGPKITIYEKGVVLSCVEGEVLLDNGEGNDPSGPFDGTSGKHLGPLFGCEMAISEYDPDIEYSVEEE